MAISVQVAIEISNIFSSGRATSLRCAVQYRLVIHHLVHLSRFSYEAVFPGQVRGIVNSTAYVADQGQERTQSVTILWPKSDAALTFPRLKRGPLSRGLVYCRGLAWSLLLAATASS
jgi:hypothetical protein